MEMVKQPGWEGLVENRTRKHPAPWPLSRLCASPVSISLRHPSEHDRTTRTTHGTTRTHTHEVAGRESIPVEPSLLEDLADGVEEGSAILLLDERAEPVQDVAEALHVDVALLVARLVVVVDQQRLEASQVQDLVGRHVVFGELLRGVAGIDLELARGREVAAGPHQQVRRHLHKSASSVMGKSEAVFSTRTRHAHRQYTRHDTRTHLVGSDVVFGAVDSEEFVEGLHEVVPFGLLHPDEVLLPEATALQGRDESVFHAHDSQEKEKERKEKEKGKVTCSS